METSNIILLAISSAVSFGLGRTFMHFRGKRRKKLAQEREAQVLRNRPIEAESSNKSKRKRQLQKLAKEGKNQKS
jgi:membrane protein implicated in regulation of membrane protease activity